MPAMFGDISFVLEWCNAEQSQIRFAFRDEETCHEQRYGDTLLNPQTTVTVTVYLTPKLCPNSQHASGLYPSESLA